MEVHQPSQHQSRCIAATMFAALTVSFGWTMLHANTAQGARAPQTSSYNIPSQPLNRALAHYARVSGIDVAYESDLATGRISNPVLGAHTPQTALRVLLLGTGLSARFTGSRSAIIFLKHEKAASSVGVAADPLLRLDAAQVRAPLLIGKDGSLLFRHYAQTVRDAIRAILSREPDYQHRKFSAQVSVLIDSQGRVAAVSILRGSGDQKLDNKLNELLIGHRLSSPPPADMAQPLRFEVSADRLMAQD